MLSNQLKNISKSYKTNRAKKFSEFQKKKTYNCMRRTGVCDGHRAGAKDEALVEI